MLTPSQHGGGAFFEGYTDSTSYFQGGTVHFMISCDSPGTVPSAMKIYRIGANRASDSLMTVTLRSFNCSFQPMHDKSGQVIPYHYNPLPIRDTTRFPVEYKRGCNWPLTESVPIPTTWPSGFYYARVFLPDSESSATRVGFIPFVVKERHPGSTSKILVIVPWNTYQAYNYWGGGASTGKPGSMTRWPVRGVRPQKHQDTVSFLRPMGDRWSGNYNIMTQLGHVGLF